MPVSCSQSQSALMTITEFKKKVQQKTDEAAYFAEKASEIFSCYTHHAMYLSKKIMKPYTF